MESLFNRLSNYFTLKLFKKMSKNKFRYQTETITLALGVSGINETNVVLDREFDKVVGITVYPKVQNAADFFNFGLRDNDGVIQDRTYQDDNIVTPAVPPKDRYKEVDIEAKGHTVTIQVEPLAALNATLTI